MAAEKGSAEVASPSPAWYATSPEDVAAAFGIDESGGPWCGASSVLTPSTFDSKQMNWAALGEFVLAVLTTQMDAFRRILGTTQLDLRQFGWALLAAVIFLLLWEAGKLLARRSHTE